MALGGPFMAAGRTSIIDQPDGPPKANAKKLRAKSLGNAPSLQKGDMADLIDQYTTQRKQANAQAKVAAAGVTQN